MSTNFNQFTKNVFFILNSVLAVHPSPKIFTRDTVNYLYSDNVSEEFFEKFYEAISWLKSENYVRTDGSPIQYSGDYLSKSISTVGVFITSKGLALLNVNVSIEKEKNIQERLFDFVSEAKEKLLQKSPEFLATVLMTAISRVTFS